MTSYKYKRDEDGYLMGCYSCGHEAPLRTFENANEFCQLCAESSAGNAFIYPDQYQADARILKSIAQISNIMLDQLTDRLANTSTHQTH